MHIDDIYYNNNAYNNLNINEIFDLLCEKILYDIDLGIKRFDLIKKNNTDDIDNNNNKNKERSKSNEKEFKLEKNKYFEEDNEKDIDIIKKNEKKNEKFTQKNIIIKNLINSLKIYNIRNKKNKIKLNSRNFDLRKLEEKLEKKILRKILKILSFKISEEKINLITIGKNKVFELILRDDLNLNLDANNYNYNHNNNPLLDIKSFDIRKNIYLNSNENKYSKKLSFANFEESFNENNISLDVEFSKESEIHTIM
jgi:hypothetical protein